MHSGMVRIAISNYGDADLIVSPSEPRTDHALELRWHEPRRPLPVKLIQGPRRPASEVQPLLSPPWLATGPIGQPFDFCGHGRRLLEDMVARTPDLAHVRLPQILIGVLQARNGRPHGLQARVTPLRFPHGRLQRRRRDTVYQVQRYFLGEHEFLYLMTFCLPRFQNQSFNDKVITLFHELFHLGPEFNGDLRRHEGRYQLHTHSQRCYDRYMADLARAYLQSKPNPDLHAFLHLSFAQLQHRHGAVAGIVVPRPKVIPVRSIPVDR